jgi:hypothetical protein
MMNKLTIYYSRNRRGKSEIIHMTVQHRILENKIPHIMCVDAEATKTSMQKRFPHADVEAHGSFVTVSPREKS